MNNATGETTLRWVLRPDRSAPHATELLEHAGKEIYAVVASPVSGCVDLTLADGSRVRARRDEVVAV